MTENIELAAEAFPVTLPADGLPATVTGTVFFASDIAIRERRYRENQHVTLSLFDKKVMQLAETFLQVDLDSSGRNYVHLTLDEAI